MDDITLMLVVPGVIGGALLAVTLLVANRRMTRRKIAAPTDLAPMTPDLINMAHIKVAGVGGLGLVAVAVATAVALPEAGYSLAIGLAGGIVLAAALTMWRTRVAARITPPRAPGASTMLSIEAPDESAEPQGPERRPPSAERVARPA